MKYIYSILLGLCAFLAAGTSQAQIKDTAPAGDPKPFDKFFKNTMKITPGAFPVYQDGTKYYLEISPANLNKDILIIGDVARGYANNISQSSGVIRFSEGTGNNLNVTREVYKEAVSPDFNQGIEELVQKSSLVPVSFVMPIAALGKAKGSYLIDISRQLMEGGDFFSFKDVNGLTSPDAARSGVQDVKTTNDAVVFSVLRTQTIPGTSYNGSKAIDKATAFVLTLVIQRLPDAVVKVREADPRIGFKTINYNDFGKSPYGVKNVKVITKWNLEAKKIMVIIDPTTPSLFVPYLKKAVEQWNGAFRAAGLKNPLVVSTDDKDNWLSAGKILLRWGNAVKGLVTNTVTDPRTGEILAGKMNIDVNVSNDLLPSYFAKCGFKDPRIMKDLYNPEVRGEMMEWKAAQGLGELLGMLPNLHGSAAYTTTQLRSGAWLKEHGFTSSVTDDTQFNFVVQPEDQVSVADLMPRVSAYDKLAIGWAYRNFKNTAEEKKVLSSLKISDPELLFLEENKSDPYTRRGDVSSDQLEAAILGMKNVQTFYPQVEKLTSAMKDKDEDWKNFKLLSKAFQISYQLYTDNVVSYIGGKSVRPVLKNYNEIGIVYPSKKDQQRAMALLDSWFFNGPPAWMQSKRMNQISEESETIKMGKSTQDALRKFITPEVLNNLIQAEYDLGKEAYTVSDLFNDLDHYVFKDFNPAAPVDDYRMLMQTNFVYDLSAAVAKNNITSGLSDSSEVLHLYFIRTLQHLGELSEKHQDAATRERYKMIKQKIERNINQKAS
ncbi:zinc-dependent metalloprotease [Pedobacter sp. MR2016-19]|uniref:zinc-dependent metalloprotease n=1 Tax=Pedobacter sp. MR2016-19 TaxID=2780089 RepID=UPI00187676A6|nr:zinc-dependent metalloprotease [Pedobacter sp. MR2016-19]MBE5318790.1 zinc-dependent metalloprotease [Pedobacter sp. MR2016-19]